ncbi:MAG: 50S ribosomal protein L32 [Patescibacteria group bacterium]|jgi:large subunit ribosomal protein L32
MTVPPKRLPARRRKTRASHFALKKKALLSCPKCKKSVLPHMVCQNCGFYKGRDVLKLEAKLDKKAKKKLQKQAEAEKANKEQKETK